MDAGDRAVPAHRVPAQDTAAFRNRGIQGHSRDLPVQVHTQDSLVRKTEASEARNLLPVPLLDHRDRYRGRGHRGIAKGPAHSQDRPGVAPDSAVPADRSLIAGQGAIVPVTVRHWRSCQEQQCRAEQGTQGFWSSWRISFSTSCVVPCVKSRSSPWLCNGKFLLTTVKTPNPPRVPFLLHGLRIIHLRLSYWVS